MVEVNWRRGSGPPLVAFVTLMALATAPASAVDVRPRALAAAAGPCDSATIGAAPAGRSWYRRTSKPDADGWLHGYTLSAGPSGDRISLRVALGNESFVAGPSRGVLLYGTDDGSRSEVRVVRLADGCDERILVSTDVVRGGTIHPNGTTLYLHTVDRATRTDLGIWRRAVRGAGPLVRVLPGLADAEDGRFGRTFATLLRWSESGRTLAVQTCGEVLCRTRLYDMTTGSATLDASPGQGELLGLTDRERIGYGGCHGLPCPIVAIATDGTRRTLVASADVAVLVGRGRSRQLWYEAADDHGRIHLHHRSLATGRDRELDTGHPVRLVWPARWADADIDGADDLALLSADGTWSRVRDIQAATFAGPDTLRLQSLEEVSE